MFQYYAEGVSTSTAVLGPPYAGCHLRSVCGDNPHSDQISPECAAGSATQVLEHSKHAAVINLGGRQIELGEDITHVLLNGPLGDDQGLCDSSVGPSLGHLSQYLTLAPSERFELSGPPARAEHLGYYLRIQCRSAGHYAIQRVEELPDVGDAVLEKVADTRDLARSRPGEQFFDVASFN